jgi:SAM-dependent methyltransferase
MLAEVSNGEFLQCFYQEREIFHGYYFNGKRKQPDSKLHRKMGERKDAETKKNKLTLRRLRRGILRRASRVWLQARQFIGLKTSLHSPPRYILEQIIVPHFTRRKDIKSVLFVGCDWYTKHYWKFFRGMEYWTIDPDPGKKRYGSRNHLVDFLEHLHFYFPSGYFDLIICNGVYGWGLNQKKQCETAFRNCFDCLREDGEFVLGWDDVQEDSSPLPIGRNFSVLFKELESLGWRQPVPIKELESIKAFRRQHFAPLSTWRYPVTWQYLDKGPFCHIYDFYLKQNEKARIKYQVLL